MLLNLLLIYIGSVLWVLGMLKLSNCNETFRDLSCIGSHNNYDILVTTSLIPFANTFICIVISLALLLNCLFHYSKVDKGISKIKRIIEKIVE